MNLFLYGTLMDRDVRDLVCGKSLPHVEPAKLRGYRRVFVAGRTYPMLVPTAFASVDGLVARNVDADSVFRLRIYEGWEYTLDPCQLDTDHGPVQACVFMCPNEVQPANTPWKLETWEMRHKRQFLPKVAQIMTRALNPFLPAALLGLRVCPMLSPPVRRGPSVIPLTRG